MVSFTFVLITILTTLHLSTLIEDEVSSFSHIVVWLTVWVFEVFVIVTYILVVFSG